MKKLLLALPLLLAACGSQPTVISRPVIHERPPFVPPTITPVQQQPVEWAVITRENSQDKFRALEARSGSSTVFALSPQGYQNLSLNVAELRRYIEQQNSVIAAMRRYYEAPVNHNNTTDNRENR
jgi:hypothetical protein